MAYKIVDFADIVNDIRENLKVQEGDTVTINRIKRAINKVYLQEVIPFARWKWLEGSTRVIHKARYNAGTCEVTPNSSTVTLSVTPSVSLGSFAGKKFAVDGYNEIYIISTHTAGSTTLELSSNYTGNATTTAGFKIWTDVVPLPVDCRETMNVWHNFHSKPMEGVGLQKFRQITANNPRAEAYPSFYYTGDFTDPSTGTGETESDRYRTMYIFPAINKTDCTLQIDYVKEVTALDLDGDEPVLPLEDRSVLVDGALARLWRTVASDNENAELSKRDYEQKLARMAGKPEDSIDLPKIAPTSTYVRARRASKFGLNGTNISGANGGSGYTAITYLENPTIKGANITDDVTVATGVTIDGVDISELDTSISGHIVDTSGAHLASAISFTPSGSLTSIEVQGALTELEQNKVANSGTSTDNVIARFDGITGKIVQNSGITIDDSNNITQGGVTFDTIASSTLIDNTSTPTSIFNIALASTTACIIEYSITRAGIVEIGHIYMISDLTNTYVSPVGVSSALNGISFTGDVNLANMRLLYTATSTGSNASMKYRIKKWLA